MANVSEGAAGDPAGVTPFEIGTLNDDEGDQRGEVNNNHSLPGVDEIKADRAIATEEVAPGAKLIWYASVLIAITGLIVGLTLGLQDDDGKNREEKIYQYILSEEVSQSDDFGVLDGKQGSSPHQRALNFMANDDTLQLPVPKGGVDTDEGYEFITRYVMALFYYSLDGANWNFDLLFMSDKPTCRWFNRFSVDRVAGVSCLEDDTIGAIAIEGNDLVGTIPSEVAVLTTLKQFYLLNDDVEGSIPPEFAGLTNMASFAIMSTLLTGTIPSWFDNWDKLTYLYLSNNILSSSVPQTLTSISNLEVLALDDNSLTGSATFAWDFPNMVDLYLEGNDFTGSLPNSIRATSPNLRQLDLSSNGFDGNLPSDLFLLDYLEVVDLHDNGFTGPIPDDISNGNAKLTFIALQQNSLSQGVPPEMGNLGSLTHLDLSENQLTGNIPDALQDCVNLSYLFLAENAFTEDSIPAFIYALSNLGELSLKNTGRTGRISEFIEDLDKLVLLDLDDNTLTGPIPEEIGALTKLQFLLLNNNLLTGPIPAQMSNLESLRLVLVEENSITGSLEDVCGHSGILPGQIYADCGEVTCTCCNPCCTEGESCHDFDAVASIIPMREFGYTRKFYQFGPTDDEWFDTPTDDGIP